MKDFFRQFRAVGAGPGAFFTNYAVNYWGKVFRIVTIYAADLDCILTDTKCPRMRPQVAKSSKKQIDYFLFDFL